MDAIPRAGAFPASRSVRFTMRARLQTAVIASFGLVLSLGLARPADANGLVDNCTAAAGFPFDISNCPYRAPMDPLGEPTDIKLTEGGWVRMLSSQGDFDLGISASVLGGETTLNDLTPTNALLLKFTIDITVNMIPQGTMCPLVGNGGYDTCLLFVITDEFDTTTGQVDPGNELDDVGWGAFMGDILAGPLVVMDADSGTPPICAGGVPCGAGFVQDVVGNMWFGLWIPVDSDNLPGTMTIMANAAFGEPFSGNLNISTALFAYVPEPGTGVLLGLGTFGLAWIGRRRSR